MSENQAVPGGRVKYRLEIGGAILRIPSSGESEHVATLIDDELVFENQEQRARMPAVARFLKGLEPARTFSKSRVKEASEAAAKPPAILDGGSPSVAPTPVSETIGTSTEAASVAAPQPRQTPAKPPKPRMDPRYGDKTPELVEWYRRFEPEEFERRYSVIGEGTYKAREMRRINGAPKIVTVEKQGLLSRRKTHLTAKPRD